jgi:hypothetical protein
MPPPNPERPKALCTIPDALYTKRTAHRAHTL